MTGPEVESSESRKAICCGFCGLQDHADGACPLMRSVLRESARSSAASMFKKVYQNLHGGSQQVVREGASVKTVDIPADGNCLFSSISLGLVLQISPVVPPAAKIKEYGQLPDFAQTAFLLP